MISLQTPVPSGSISSNNSLPSLDREVLKLAASRTLRRMKPKILAGVFIKNMYVIRIDGQMNRVFRRPAAHKCRQSGVVNLHAGEEMRTERFNPADASLHSRSNLQCFRSNANRCSPGHSNASVEAQASQNELSVVEV